MRTVILTGGIASGKTAVSERFAAAGAAVIDTDLIAHELTTGDGAALTAIRERFGDEVFTAEGVLDRSALRRRIFEDDDERQALEAILHPMIRAVVAERLQTADGPYALLVVPLFVETGFYDTADRVVVVDVPRDVQRSRLMARDDISEALADAMIEAQASREARLAVATHVIDNSGSLPALDRQVTALHREFAA